MPDWKPATREEIIGCPDPAAAKEVRVTRSKLYPQPARPGPAWYWLYCYTVDGGPEREYGQGLADTRRWLKRNFPNATIIETWK